MTKYTDADVARMLGWCKCDNQDIYSQGVTYYIKPLSSNRVVSILHGFGLSTPPSPDANANTARYVIPFIEAQGWYFRHEIDCGDHVVTITDLNPNEYSGYQELGYDLGDCFASTVCRAALQAWEAKKGTNHE